MTPPRALRGSPALASAVASLAPIVFLLWLWGDGLQTWFVADDFAWLGLLRQVGTFSDFLRAMFAPAAQGTFRFLSERGFFLLFERLFGLDNLPFRICVFATVAADIMLITWLTTRLTGSRRAGFIAPFLWLVNTALATVMAWSSAWNEALCPLFLLTSLGLFIRFAETGRQRFWWWQAAIFVAGFGALEINAMYPAIAAAYVVFAYRGTQPRKRLLLSLAPLFVVSTGYFALHSAVAPFVKDGPYAMHFDGRMLPTLAFYWQWSLVPEAWEALGHSPATRWVILSTCTLALAGYCVREIRKRHFWFLFPLSWFLLTLGPMLPLAGHMSDYYLTIPLIGLAILGAAAFEAAWDRGPDAAARTRLAWRLIALLPLIGYLGGMIPSTRFAAHWWLERSLPVRALVLGVDAARKTHPGKVIVLDGITGDLYENSFAHLPFYPLGFDDVYLTPESAKTLQPSLGAEKLPNLVLEPSVLRNGLNRDQAVIYSVFGDHLRNITEIYKRAELASGFGANQDNSTPRRVEVGNPLFGWLLGPEWFPAESGVRWMPAHATVKLRAPVSGRERLLLEGFCPPVQLQQGPVHLSVVMDGIPLAETEISNPESNFQRLYTLPPAVWNEARGKESVEIGIAVKPVIRGSDGRERGLIFGTIAMQP